MAYYKGDQATSEAAGAPAERPLMPMITLRPIECTEPARPLTRTQRPNPPSIAYDQTQSTLMDCMPGPPASLVPTPGLAGLAFTQYAPMKELRRVTVRRSGPAPYDPRLAPRAGRYSVSLSGSGIESGRQVGTQGASGELV
jgi:hypothetical protein